MTIIERFRAFSVRTKLVIAFGSIVALFLIFGLYLLSGINRYQREIAPAVTSVRDLKAALLEMRRAEKEFLTYEVIGADDFRFYRENTSTNLQQWTQAYGNFKRDVVQLTPFLEKYHPESLNDLSRAEALVDEYRDTISQLVDVFHQRGAGSYGREGQLTTIAENTEAQFVTSPALTTFLQVREHEKSFLYRKTEQDLENFETRMSQLKSQNVARTQVQEYETAFNNLVTLDKQIGLNNEDGLRGVLKTHTDQLPPLIDSIETATIELTGRNTQLVIFIIVILGIAITLFGFGFAFLIAHLISQPLIDLQKGAEAIAAGDLDYRFPQFGNNEIGKLGMALNQMAAKLQNSYAELEHKNQELENNVDKLEQTKKATLNILEDLKESQLTIQAEKARDDALLASIGDGVFAVDLQERLILINKAAADLIHVQEDQVLGKKYQDVFKFQLEADPTKPYPSFVSTVIKTGAPQSMVNHTLLVKPDGKKIPIADSSAPIKDTTGKVVGCVVVFRDVTQERLVEETKDNFLAVAAHQLRAPLGSMRWNLEMVLDGEMGELAAPVKHRATLVYQSLLHMIQLVNDLLNVAHIDQNSIQQNVVPTNPLEVIQAAINNVQVEAVNKHVEVVVNHSPQAIPTIELDPHHLQLVIQHLLANAIRYNEPSGNVKVSVSLQSNHLLFSVADTGIGIPKIEQEHVFTRFFRAKNALKNATEGSGLGLFVVKSYVEAWGGKIWFMSPTQVVQPTVLGAPATGSGTTFFFTLPLKPRVKSNSKTTPMPVAGLSETPDTASGQVPPADPGPLNESTGWSTKRIIVADDDERYGEIFKLKLSAAGFNVEVVRDGAQALTAALDRKPDLMVIDLIMPVKDGFETLKELKENPQLKDIKAVAMSNLGQEDDIQRAKALGAIGYLIKTNLSVREMVAEIKKYVTV